VFFLYNKRRSRRSIKKKTSQSHAWCGAVRCGVIKKRSSEAAKQRSTEIIATPFGAIGHKDYKKAKQAKHPPLADLSSPHFVTGALLRPSALGGGCELRAASYFRVGKLTRSSLSPPPCLLGRRFAPLPLVPKQERLVGLRSRLPSEASIKKK
jgi:hypothetical protein